MRNLMVLLAAVVPVLAGCALPRSTTTLVPRDSSSAAASAVPWVDRPAPPYRPPAPTTYPTDARPCRASDLAASPGRVGAAGGMANIRVEFTNRADTVCVLLGYPRVAGVSAAGAVTALHPRHGSVIGVAPWPAADIAPGQRAAVNISSPDGCAAAQRRQFRPVYPRLRVVLPSGGFLDVPDRHFDTVCGVEVSRFGVPALARREEPAPSPLTARMTTPATAHAGEQIVYTVTLRNRTGTAYSLSPCPAYEEYVVDVHGGYVHPNYYLNCDAVHAIPAGAAVTFRMRLRLPANFRKTGLAKFGWLMQATSAPPSPKACESRTDRRRARLPLRSCCGLPRSVTQGPAKPRPVSSSPIHVRAQ